MRKSDPFMAITPQDKTPSPITPELLGVIVIAIPLLIGTCIFCIDAFIAIDAYMRNLQHPTVHTWRSQQIKQIEAQRETITAKIREYETQGQTGKIDQALKTKKAFEQKLLDLRYHQPSKWWPKVFKPFCWLLDKYHYKLIS